MQAYLASIHDEMQDVITTGPIVPQKPNPAYNVNTAGEVSRTLDKVKDEYEGDDKKRANLDAVCKNFFFQSLGDVMFHRVKHCKTAKEIWDSVCTICEGSEKIRKSKLDMYVTRFKTTKMKEGETVENYEIRISGLLNDIIALDYEIDQEELNYKILTSLTPAWDVKTEVMKSMLSKDTTTSFIWNDLKAYEFDKMKHKMESGEAGTDDLALSAAKGQTEKRIAEKKPAESSKRTESEMCALFMKKMDKLGRKFERSQSYDKNRGRYGDQQRPSYDNRRQSYGEGSKNYNDSPRKNYSDQRPQHSDPARSNKYESNKYESNNTYQKDSYQSKHNSGDKNQLLCHNCKQPGHFKRECPKPRQNRYTDNERRDRDVKKNRIEALAAELSKLQDEVGDSSSDESDDDYDGVAERPHRKSHSSSEEDKGLIAECESVSSLEDCLALMADCEEVTSSFQKIPLHSSHTEHSDSSSSTAMSENSMYWCYKQVKKDTERLTAENLKLAKINLELAEKVSKFENQALADGDHIRALESKIAIFKLNNIELTKENLSYSDVIDRLKARLAKFAKASKALDEIQGIQKPFGDKTGIGFSSQVDDGAKTKHTPQAVPSKGKGCGIFEVKSQEMQRLVNDSLKRQSKHGVGYVAKGTDKAKSKAKNSFSKVPYAETSKAADLRQRAKIMEIQRIKLESVNSSRKPSKAGLKNKASLKNKSKDNNSSDPTWRSKTKMSNSSKNDLNKTPKKFVQQDKNVDKAGEVVTMTYEHPFEYGPTRNNGQAIFVPHYLRWKDPTFHTVLMASNVYERLINPGQKKMWVHKGRLTNAIRSREMDT